LECSKHKIKKDYLFCLESGCSNRLTCKKCYEQDHQHLNHDSVFIDGFMK